MTSEWEHRRAHRGDSCFACNDVWPCRTVLTEQLARVTSERASWKEGYHESVRKMARAIADREIAVIERDALSAQNAALVAALRWYADIGAESSVALLDDHGKRARALISRLPEGEATP